MSDEKKLSSYITKSKLIHSSNSEKKIRIAILGGFTLNGLEETMRVNAMQKKYNVLHMYLDTINTTRRF